VGGKVIISEKTCWRC